MDLKVCPILLYVLAKNIIYILIILLVMINLVHKESLEQYQWFAFLKNIITKNKFLVL